MTIEEMEYDDLTLADWRRMFARILTEEKSMLQAHQLRNLAHHLGKTKWATEYEAAAEAINSEILKAAEEIEDSL